jgi:hypothetical protein
MEVSSDDGSGNDMESQSNTASESLVARANRKKWSTPSELIWGQF